MRHPVSSLEHGLVDCTSVPAHILACSVQATSLVETTEQQAETIRRISEDLLRAQDTLAMTQAQQRNDLQYTETKLLREMRQRAAAHTHEAAVSTMHAEQLNLECEKLRCVVDATQAAHLRERESLTTELAELRLKCKLRVKQAEDAQNLKEEMAHALRFNEQQVEQWRKAADEVEASACQHATRCDNELERLQAEAQTYELEAQQQQDQIERLKATVCDLQAQVCLRD